MSKHTRNPWLLPEYSPLCVRDSDDRIIADCSGAGRTQSEARANAELVRAAAEMHDAIRMFLEEYDAGREPDPAWLRYHTRAFRQVLPEDRP